MKAIRIHSYGGPEVLAQVEMQRPTPGPNEVLIKVQAASVNPVDWKIRAGYTRDFLLLALPATLGSDVSGTVEEVARARLDSNEAKHNNKKETAWFHGVTAFHGGIPGIIGLSSRHVADT